MASAPPVVAADPNDRPCDKQPGQGRHRLEPQTEVIRATIEFRDIQPGLRAAHVHLGQVSQRLGRGLQGRRRARHRCER